MRKEVIGDATLYLGDCLDVMQSLGPVDHVISDPPFEAEAHTKQRRALGRGSADGRRDIIEAALPFSAITSEQREQSAAWMARLSHGWILVFCQAEALTSWKLAFEAEGAKYRRAMVWIKPDGMPQFTGDRPGMGYETICASWAGHGASSWNGGGKHGVFTFPKHDSGSGHGGLANEHPTTKPQRLMAELVKLFSNADETILDPYCGSGSTGVACVNLERKFIGIERDPKYFDIACRRIDAAYKQPRLFKDEPVKAVQDALL